MFLIVEPDSKHTKVSASRHALTFSTERMAKTSVLYYEKLFQCFIFHALLKNIEAVSISAYSCTYQFSYIHKTEQADISGQINSANKV